MTARGEVGTQEGQVTGAQGQLGRAVILGDFPPPAVIAASRTGSSSRSGRSTPSRASAVANNGMGASDSLRTAHSALRRARPSPGWNASAAASRRNAPALTPARRRSASI
ncbi:hypothetical protein mvi_47810 [Methylobacterium indicum]|uniref:Uncharacterized protein n=1 Tax=Methylobacterium indicum TaxID=1775910 RepID=A0A8H8WXC2_9HYPH|nr:hypothetical protein mvi_47810 [Methylobacterium indicum]